MKQLHDLVMTRTSSREAFGFRIIGGKDEGQTFKVKPLFHQDYCKPGVNPIFLSLALKKDRQN